MLDVLPASERPEEVRRASDGTIVREVLRRSGERSRSVISSSPDDSDPHSAFDRALLRSTTWPEYGTGGNPVRVVDLFSGCGAMSLGLAEACRALGRSFEPVLACDVNTTALEVYARNFGIPQPAARDLGELSSLIEAAMTPAEVALARIVKDVDVVVAGPPCQGHSNLNNVTRRSDPKNALYFKVARFAKLFSPKFILIENVPAVIKDRGGVVPRTMRALEELGYRVKVGNVDMTRIGVAQTRRRHILLAFRQDVLFRVPEIKEVQHAYAVTPRTLRWAIEDLEMERDGDSFDGPTQMTEVTRERIEHLFAEDLFDLPDTHRPDCHRTKDHNYRAVYGRLRWDRPGPTITSGFNTMGQGRFVHPSRRRTLTPHEAARIQFIPDFFDLRSVPTRTKLTEIIGNAVPPKLSYVFGLEMLR